MILALLSLGVVHQYVGAHPRRSEPHRSIARVHAATLPWLHRPGENIRLYRN